jgi:hypothetical protein
VPNPAQITDADRRARLATRQLLSPGARMPTPETAADALVALHATDPATVFLALATRLTAPSIAAVEQSLYGEKPALVRLLAMRRTMFVVGRELAAVVDSAAARAIAAKERKGLLAHLADGGGWDAAWLARTEAEVLAALGDGGPMTGARLGAVVPALRERVTVAVGKPYETTQNVASRVLRVLAAENRIRRDRPSGSWTSSQFRWVPGRPLPELPAAGARADLARAWLAVYGPGTEADLKWWTGWTLGDVRKALVAVGAEPVRLDDGQTGHVLPGDTGPEPAPEPWAALLPALDPTPMGYQQRDWYLPPAHVGELFDRTGNIGPTVWWDGRIVGGWAQRPDGELVWQLLDKVPRTGLAEIGAEAARLTAFIGDARVTPRFRTPLERRLVAG